MLTLLLVNPPFTLSIPARGDRDKVDLLIFWILPGQEGSVAYGGPLAHYDAAQLP